MGWLDLRPFHKPERQRRHVGNQQHRDQQYYDVRQRRAIDALVAVEADWPAAARVDNYVLGDPPRSTVSFTPFARFPTWMWCNDEIHNFIEWLRARNLTKRGRMNRVGFHGLNLYSMFTSIALVLAYLDEGRPGCIWRGARSLRDTDSLAEGSSRASSGLVRVWVAGAMDADLVIGELKVRAGDRDARHVALRAFFLAYRAGGSVVCRCGGFC